MHTHQIYKYYQKVTGFPQVENEFLFYNIDYIVKLI